ncbi:MAG: PRC-barrel domain-containing protein [Bacteroidia bacterium]|nr:PRC-barrel domain-containing protein [Bacteroidia bacterium]
MQININNLIGYNLEATDGEIGKVKEFYFDDKTWEIRYLIVKTGNWLTGRKVLISPQALLVPDWGKEVFPINLSKEQIKNSPDIDTDKPISRRQEIKLYGHYPWRSYWGSGFYAGGFGGYINSDLVIDERIAKDVDFTDQQSDDDPHLRSTERVSGYHIHATDGDIGHVKDFIIDDQTWQVTDLVIDTHNWIGGKKVLIPVRHVKDIQWDNFKIITDISIAFIKDCPLFNESEYNHPETAKYVL